MGLIVLFYQPPTRNLLQMRINLYTPPSVPLLNNKTSNSLLYNAQLPNHQNCYHRQVFTDSMLKREQLNTICVIKETGSQAKSNKCMCFRQSDAVCNLDLMLPSMRKAIETQLKNWQLSCKGLSIKNTCQTNVKYKTTDLQVQYSSLGFTTTAWI